MDSTYNKSALAKVLAWHWKATNHVARTYGIVVFRHEPSEAGVT